MQGGGPGPPRGHAQGAPRVGGGGEGGEDAPRSQACGGGGGAVQTARPGDPGQVGVATCGQGGGFLFFFFFFFSGRWSSPHAHVDTTHKSVHTRIHYT